MKNLFSLKIKSFVLGRGRITSSQRNAIDNLGDKFINDDIELEISIVANQQM